ncbi:MAG: tetratricopeptide repeat protein [Chitinophagaceae bacterium]|nr:tetratricopeptide repeat protein [Chitinophagaceae bacterium]MCW5925511.1 tetratricopeptide repeat protein [Chitinophagaceae bacterium]
MNDPYFFIERARLLKDQKRTNEAIKQLNSALQLDPDNDEALSLYAHCYYDKKDYRKGIEIIDKALAIDPENGYYHYLKGFGYYSLNENTIAISILHQSIKLYPQFAESYGLMAHAYCEDINFEAALEKANEGLAIDPENITCLSARSIALNKLKKTADSIETIQTALSRDPENEYAHATAGWNYLESGKHKKAVGHFREALRINPNYENAKEGLKQALKSKIPPYKWMLQYSFWLQNQGKNAAWIVPVSLFIGVRLLSTIFGKINGTENVAVVIIGCYLLFVVTSWIISPLANLFLLFHRDGKYALDTTEKNTAITVVSSLIAGGLLIVVSTSTPAIEKSSYFSSFIIAAAAFLLTAVPLGKLQYPLSFTAYDTGNKVSLILVCLGLFTALSACIYPPVSIVSGAIFLLIFIVDNWFGVFNR